jgi:hypothetical protein
LYLALGKLIVDTRAIPTTDPFVFTVPESPPGVYDKWASCVGAYLLHDLGGLDLLILLKASAVLLASACAALFARRLAYRSALVPAIILLGLWAGCDRFIERTSLVSDTLTAVVLAVLCLERRAPTRWLWSIPVIFAVWVNVHPGYFVAAGLLGFAVLSSVHRWREPAFRRLLVCAGSSGLACLLNPRLLEGAIHPLRFALGPELAVYRQHYWEYQPTLGPHYLAWPQTWLFIALCIVTGTLGLLALRATRSAALFGLLSFAFLVWLGLTAVRFATTASLALPVLAVDFAASLNLLRIDEVPRKRLAGAASIAVGIAALALNVKLAAFGYAPASGARRLGLGVDPVSTPFRAAEFLERIGFGGRLFNQHEYGAYLAWRWGPRRRLFYHGMVENIRFYVDDVVGVSRSTRDFERIVDTYELTAFLLPRWDASPTHGPVVLQQLLTRPDWHLVFWDDGSVVWLRDAPWTRAAISRYEYRAVDPFRLDRLRVALEHEPQRAFDEAVRAVRDSPESEKPREILENVFAVDPESVLTGGATGTPAR